MLDADIRDFFSKLDQAWLMKFLEHRIADRAGPAAHPKVVERRGHRGRELVGDARGDTAGGIGFAAARQRVPPLRLRPVGPAVEDGGTPAVT